MEQANQFSTRYVQIRSPSMNQTLSFPFDNDTTVDSLKKVIQTSHPQQPATKDQRIIFRGKVLMDTEILSTLLEKCDNSTIPTFHLVVKPSLSETSTSPTPPSTSITDPSLLSQHPAPSSSLPASDAFIPSTTHTTTYAYTPTVPALVPGGYQIVAINGQFFLAPVLVPTMPIHPVTTATAADGLSSASSTTLPQTPMAPHIPPQQQAPVPGRGAARMIGRPRAMQRGATVWLALKLVFVLFITCHGASIERVIFFHFLALVFFMYQTGRFRLVIRRVTLEDLQNRFQPVGGGGAGGAGGIPPLNGAQQRDVQFQQRPTPATAAAPAPSVHPSPTMNQQSEQHQQQQPQQQQRHLQQESNQATQSNASATPNPATPGPTAPTLQQEQESSNPTDHHTTRLSVLKRGAFTFVASLWPNYGQDPRLAQAFQNEQQDEMEEL
ncbi:hypothetical protein BCR42DRAFT_449833 [Absidia repens]|uniref:Ubiquitin-like domain-containing protein n=1 Tax=Absidia repens TaxID=90262 RepID=A0A1X2ILN7_9FUNG|nr:hypothetical protein BCR42DRAFT_449833 [Absidia repens]